MLDLDLLLLVRFASALKSLLKAEGFEENRPPNPLPKLLSLPRKSQLDCFPLSFAPVRA